MLSLEIQKKIYLQFIVATSLREMASTVPQAISSVATKTSYSFTAGRIFGDTNAHERIPVVLSKLMGISS